MICVLLSRGAGLDTKTMNIHGGPDDLLCLRIAPSIIFTNFINFFMCKQWEGGME